MLKRDVAHLALAAVATLTLAVSAGAGQVGTHYFYWYDCPNVDCDTSRMPYDPPGATSPYNGTYYTSLSTDWHEWQVTDLEAAGFDCIFPVSWGERYHPNHFKQSVLTRLVTAIQNTGADLKVGLYDDTQSEPMEWNADNGRGYVNSTTDPNLQMSLADPAAPWYFYNQKIKPFFQMIPQSMWATHNGLPVSQGGRPLILTFTIYYYKDRASAHTMWQAVKNAFVADFGVEPWLLADWSWWYFCPNMGQAADGECIYGAAGPAGIQTYTAPNGYKVSNLGPGRDDRYIGGTLYHPRWSDGDGYDDGLNDQWLRDNFDLVPADADLIVLESWNELWEGSALSRCVDFPARLGGTLPDDYYITKTRTLIDAWKNVPPPAWQASYVSDTLPAQMDINETLTVSVTFNNTGSSSWDTTATRLGTSNPRDRNSTFYVSTDWLGATRPTAVDAATGSGQNGTFTFVVTAPSTPGQYSESFELVQEGVAWFDGTGDDITWNVDVVDTSQPVEKLDHGDMEGGFWDTGWGGGSALPTGWDGWYNPGDFNCYDETTIVHGGGHSAKTKITSGGDAGNGGYKRSIHQNVYVGPNASFTFTVWARHTNGNCPSIMGWNHDNDNNPHNAYTGGRYQWVTTDNWGQLNQWVSRTMTGTASSSGQITIMVGGAHHGGGGQGLIYIDDASVTVP